MDNFENTPTIPNSNTIKPSLNHQNVTGELSIEDIGHIVDLKFRDRKDFGDKMGWGKVAVSRFLTGDWIPSKPIIIIRLCNVLDINQIKLTRLLDRLALEIVEK